MTASTFPAEVEGAVPYVEEEDLAKGLAGLRRRASMAPTDRWLAIAGGVLMPLGVILVIIGWYGAAHTTRLFEEVPYLISGGLLGIVLSTIGAALYFGYWLTRIVAGERQPRGRARSSPPARAACSTARIARSSPTGPRASCAPSSCRRGVCRRASSAPPWTKREKSLLRGLCRAQSG